MARKVYLLSIGQRKLFFKNFYHLRANNSRKIQGKQMNSLSEHYMHEMEANKTNEQFIQIEKSVLDKILERLNVLESLLREQKIRAHSDSSASSLEEPVDKVVEFKIYKRSVLATGNTKPHREFMRKNKGSFNSTLKGWIFNKDNGRKAAKRFKKKHIDIAEVQAAVLMESESEYSSSD